MNDPEEGFLQRWARRKTLHEAEARGPREDPPPAAALPDPAPEPAAPPELPPVETLTAESDFTAFLKAEVPPALRKAALRRAWTTNPAIAGHKPLVDYDWDFNAPGYGKLWDVDDGKKLASALLRHLEDRPAVPSVPQAAEPPAPEDAPARLEELTPPAAEDPSDDPQPTA